MDYVHKQFKGPEYLTVLEVSKTLNIHPRTVCMFCKEGTFDTHQHLGGKGKWRIDTAQFIDTPYWVSFVEKWGKNVSNRLKSQI
ncbi:hypothetical protein JFL43_03455 [Viridibacillus sp. YIM B01967]|uniref:Helix-turn-helix domain-containing protein n=1 Tax=Viridibacillus soli TaxID=2798301 RepID=A0ABS1H3D2_9BACL|nr:hypothetical protein [Viridibacillus soli]MBK3493928.1 hypothetical protein [Viridibacillus soli]